MNDIVFAGNRALYLILVMSAGPIAVATFVGLLVGLFQTVTQLQEQTLPFGVKLLCVSICFFLMGNDSNLLIVFYVQIMPDDFVMQLHRF